MSRNCSPSEVRALVFVELMLLLFKINFGIPGEERISARTDWVLLLQSKTQRRNVDLMGEYFSKTPDEKIRKLAKLRNWLIWGFLDFNTMFVKFWAIQFSRRILSHGWEHHSTSLFWIKLSNSSWVLLSKRNCALKEINNSWGETRKNYLQSMVWDKIR